MSDKVGKIQLVSSDNEVYWVEKDVAERSVLIKNMLEGDYPFVCMRAQRRVVLISFRSDVGESDQPIPLPNVSSSVMKKVGATRFSDSCRPINRVDR